MKKLQQLQHSKSVNIYINTYCYSYIHKHNEAYCYRRYITSLPIWHDRFPLTYIATINEKKKHKEEISERHFTKKLENFIWYHRFSYQQRNKEYN